MGDSVMDGHFSEAGQAMMNEPSTAELTYLERIDSLVNLFREAPFSWDAVLSHLLIDTFYGSDAFAHILHTVRDDGLLAMPAKSGFTVWPTEKFPDRHITAPTLLNSSLRTGQIVECGGFDSFTFAGPDYLLDLFPNGFESSIAWPVPGVGSVLTFYSRETELTEALRKFLKTVGYVISMAAQFSLQEVEAAPALEPEHPHTAYTLTARQWNILKLIRRGKTNPEIAEDLGFSESLVRHESMKIYSTLSINGRKELIDMPEDKFPFLDS
jgi:DNA-binding CsgD family transcriptional regulator